MSKAIETCSTVYTTQNFEYVGPGRVKVTLGTATGETTSYVISLALAVESVTTMVALLNENPNRVLADIHLV